MKTVLKVTACMVVSVCLFLGYIKQETKIDILQSDVEFLQFMDSLQSKRIDHLREHTFVADSMIIETIKQFNN